MKKAEFHKQLDQTVPAMPAAFENKLQQTLEDISAHKQAEARDTLQRHTRLPGGFPRKILWIAIIAVILVGAAALATSLLRQNVFEVILGDSPENAAGIMQYDLAGESFGEYDVEIRQAAYDGVSLYVVYSIRDRSETELMGILDTEPDVYYITSEALDAVEQSGVGWWGSTFWIDGEPVQIPSLSCGATRGSETPGEVLFYELFRLDQAGIFLDGTAVEIALPIGEKPSQDTLCYREDNDITAKPDTGLVTFLLDCSVRSGVTGEHPAVPVSLPFGFAEVPDVTYSPIQIYVTLQYTVTPEALAAYRAEYGESCQDNDVIAGWISSLMLVDADGTPVYNADNSLLQYGLLGYWNFTAWFTFPYLESCPAEMYLAPVTGGAADMTLAVRVR